jgi:hypothetical protein
MRNREFYFPGVIIAGLVGVLPAIAGNCCCLCGFLTAFIGLMAVALVRKKSGGIPIELGEASLIGLIAGGITALIAIALNLVARLGLQSYVSELQATLPGNRLQSLDLAHDTLGIAVGAVLSLVLHAGSGALGGLLAVPLLKTSEGSLPPTMP